MKFTISRENLLNPLQQIVGVIERRQTLPVLANVLMRLNNNVLELTGTDLELQLITLTETDSGEDGETTVPARKLFDVCRTLPDGATVRVECRGDRCNVGSGRSRFSLSTLPASSYPAFDLSEVSTEFSLPGRVLKRSLGKTLFAMGVQDVRFYLNGLLLEVTGSSLRTVASDGHRLALCEESAESPYASEATQIIIPRKGAVELHRLLNDLDDPVRIQIAPNNVRLIMGGLTFSAKLIDSRYPPYQRTFPQEIRDVLTVDRDAFKSALTRVSVLLNEKMRAVSFIAKGDTLSLSARNPEQENAEEELEIELNGNGVDIGFNAGYLLDTLNNIDSERVRMSFSEGATNCLIEDLDDPRCKFIVVPMLI